MFLCGRARHSKPSQRDGLECLAAIQKLFGSFKGDAFDKRVLPFFHACNDASLVVLIMRLYWMPWNTSPVTLRARCRKDGAVQGNAISRIDLSIW